MKTFNKIIFTILICLGCVCFVSCSIGENTVINVDSVESSESMSDSLQTTEPALEDGYVAMPDFMSMPLSQAKTLAAENNLTLEVAQKIITYRKLDEPIVYLQYYVVGEVLPEDSTVLVIIDIGDPIAAAQNGEIEDFAGMEPLEAYNYFQSFNYFEARDTTLYHEDIGEYSTKHFTGYYEIPFAFVPDRFMAVESSPEDYGKIISLEFNDTTLYSEYADTPQLPYNRYYFTVGYGTDPLPYVQTEEPDISDHGFLRYSSIAYDSHEMGIWGDTVDERSVNYTFVSYISADDGETYEYIGGWDRDMIELIKIPTIHEAENGTEFLIKVDSHLWEYGTYNDTHMLSLQVDFQEEIEVTDIRPITKEEIESEIGENDDPDMEYLLSNYPEPFYKITGNFKQDNYYALVGENNSVSNNCLEDGVLYISFKQEVNGAPIMITTATELDIQNPSENNYVLSTIKPYMFEGSLPGQETVQDPADTTTGGNNKNNTYIGTWRANNITNDGFLMRDVDGDGELDAVREYYVKFYDDGRFEAIAPGYPTREGTYVDNGSLLIVELDGNSHPYQYFEQEDSLQEPYPLIFERVED